MIEKAEAIRCNVYSEIINEKYDFFSNNKTKESFLDYFEEVSRPSTTNGYLPSSTSVHSAMANVPLKS